ncbi:hypothetical protein H4Q26_017151 [Puccinia striiformis f. sp. tritici PST-130]|nr:hypothetical protein H4Q26_017151 [Puccinia striiformis f. sp. tritici PST-130]
MNQFFKSIFLLSSVLFGITRAGIFSSNGDIQAIDIVRLKKHLAGSSKGTMVAFMPLGVVIVEVSYLNIKKLRVTSRIL